MKIQIIEIDKDHDKQYTLEEFLDLKWHGLYVKSRSEIEGVLSKKAYEESEFKDKSGEKTYLVLEDENYITRYEVTIKVEIIAKVWPNSTYYPKRYGRK